MHTLDTKSGEVAESASLIWRENVVKRGDASVIATLTHYGRNYVDKVLRGKRSSAAVEAAALKFYELRKELLES